MYRITANLPDAYRAIIKERLQGQRRKSVSEYLAQLVEDDLRRQGLLGEPGEKRPGRKGPH